MIVAYMVVTNIMAAALALLVDQEKNVNMKVVRDDLFEGQYFNFT